MPKINSGTSNETRKEKKEYYKGRSTWNSSSTTTPIGQPQNGWCVHCSEVSLPCRCLEKHPQKTFTPRDNISLQSQRHGFYRKRLALPSQLYALPRTSWVHLTTCGWACSTVKSKPAKVKCYHLHSRSLNHWPQPPCMPTRHHDKATPHNIIITLVYQLQGSPCKGELEAY